jgi:hypothetical protein
MSDHHDGGVVADAGESVANDRVVDLKPAMGSERPCTDTEHPVGVDSSSGKNALQYEGSLQALSLTGNPAYYVPVGPDDLCGCLPST